MYAPLRPDPGENGALSPKLFKTAPPRPDPGKNGALSPKIFKTSPPSPTLIMPCVWLSTRPTLRILLPAAHRPEARKGRPVHPCKCLLKLDLKFCRISSGDQTISEKEFAARWRVRLCNLVEVEHQWPSSIVSWVGSLRWAVGGRPIYTTAEPGLTS